MQKQLLINLIELRILLDRFLLDNNELNKLLQATYYEFVFNCYEEYYQYFIIDENDVGLFKKHCNYDIQYDAIKDLYILCLDHIGIPWYLINTKFSLDNLSDNYIFNSTNDIYTLFKNKD